MAVVDVGEPGAEEPVGVTPGDIAVLRTGVSAGPERGVVVDVGPMTGVGGTGTRAVGARSPASGVLVGVGAALSSVPEAQATAVVRTRSEIAPSALRRWDENDTIAVFRGPCRQVRGCWQMQPKFVWPILASVPQKQNHVTCQNAKRRLDTERPDDVVVEPGWNTGLPVL